MNDEQFLQMACEQALDSQREGGVATGAILVKAGEVVAKSHDKTRQLNDPIAVAAVDCIRTAGRRSDQSELTLYLTEYPDMLSVGTILQFSIGSVIVGLSESLKPPIALLQEKGVPVQFVAHRACEELNLL